MDSVSAIKQLNMHHLLPIPDH